MKKIKRIFIIAEAGVNHNGSVEIAKKMVDAAKKAGADAVKFQSFKAEKMICQNDAQFNMIKRLELGVNAHKELMRHCSRKKIMFLSSPFDMESVELLAALGLKIFKIPSGEITNIALLKKIGKLGKRIILSTGMADINEIGYALEVLRKSGTPKERITVLHCSTEYPAPFKDVNLRAMLTIRNAFKVKVGYSDHTLGIEVPIAAVALGASVIEKHFTMDRNMEGPDHKASLEPHELKAMICAIRNVEKSIGDGIKRPSPVEVKNRRTVRKSIVASRRIRKGKQFSGKNITVKRPASGISPAAWDEVIAKPAKRDFKKDEMIEL